MLGHYGETIAKLRQQRGMSRRALARRAQIPGRDLAEAEKCSSRPAAAAARAIAAGLGVSRDELDIAAGLLPPKLARAVQANPRLFLDMAHEAWERPERSSGGSARPPLPEAVLTTRLGKLYQADCLSVMAHMESDSVDLLFADPPFNLAKDYGIDVDDALGERQYLLWSLDWLAEGVRVLRPGGSFFLYNLPKWNLRLGAWLCQHLEFRHWIAVDIKFSLPISGRLYPSHYSLLYFAKGSRPGAFSPPRIPIETCRHCGGELRDYGGYKDRMNPRGVNITDVWTDLSPVRHSRFKRRKANELPLKMLDRVLDIASSEGDLVFDPFGGSGTTYVAAELKGRRWLGVEIADCDPIVERFGELDREQELLEEIRQKVNVLFTEEALALRARNGHDTSKYRVASESGRTEGSGRAYPLFE